MRLVAVSALANIRRAVHDMRIGYPIAGRQRAGGSGRQLTRRSGPVIDRTFEDHFSGPGAQVYACTFG